MAGVGRTCVNYKSGKPSYVSVYDSIAPFDGTTGVASVTDAGNELSWDPTIVVQTSTTLKIRLKGKGKHSHLAKKGKKTVRRLDDPNNPTSGTLLITLSGAGAQDVPIQDAQYVDDLPPAFRKPKKK